MTPDAPATPTEPSRWVRRLWSYMARHRRDVTLSLSAAVVGSVCLVLVPLIERQIIDAVIIAHTSPLWPWLLARVEAEMIRRIDELCARTPDPGRLMESLVWLGAAIDDWQAQRAAERRAE